MGMGISMVGEWKWEWEWEWLYGNGREWESERHSRTPLVGMRFSGSYNLSHCHSIAWDRFWSPVWSLCVYVCVCVCMCLSVLSRSQFWTDFDEIWHSHQEPERKEPFRWGQNPIRVSPILPNFTPNWHPRNAFSMGDLKLFSAIISGPIIEVHSSNFVPWQPSTSECENVVKGGVARVTWPQYFLGVKC